MTPFATGGERGGLAAGRGITAGGGSGPAGFHAPATAVTPSLVPRKAWLPLIDSDAKCGRVVPRLSEYRTAPVGRAALRAEPRDRSGPVLAQPGHDPAALCVAVDER